MNKLLRANSYLCLSAIAIAIAAGSCKTKKEAAAQTVTLKTTATSTGSSATATIGPSKKEGIKKFSDLIPAKTKGDMGLFNTYKVDGKYYFEIPDSLLNREMMVITRLVKTPANVKVGNEQYGGEEENDQVWKWERHDK